MGYKKHAPLGLDKPEVDEMVVDKIAVDEPEPHPLSHTMLWSYLYNEILDIHFMLFFYLLQYHKLCLSPILYFELNS